MPVTESRVTYWLWWDRERGGLRATANQEELPRWAPRWPLRKQYPGWSAYNTGLPGSATLVLVYEDLLMQEVSSEVDWPTDHLRGLTFAAALHPTFTGVFTYSTIWRVWLPLDREPREPRRLQLYKELS